MSCRDKSIQSDPLKHLDVRYNRKSVAEHGFASRLALAQSLWFESNVPMISSWKLMIQIYKGHETDGNLISFD